MSTEPTARRGYKAGSAQQQAAPTPTEEIVASAKKVPVTVSDENGRTLKVKFLGITDQMRVVRVLGPDLSKNEQYKALAILSFCVIEINGDVVVPPATIREVEHMVDRLGDEGARAIGKAYKDSGWIARDDDEDEIVTAKN